MTRRGQLVLVAAGVIAVALIPVVLAYFQLGYTDDVDAGGDVEAPDTDTLRALERAAFDAGRGVQGTYPSGQTAAAAEQFDERFDDRVRAVERGRLDAGVVVDVRRNETVALAWRDARCPGGPDRAFGNCTVRNATVLQERAGQIHVLAVGIDVTIATDGGQIEGTYVLRADVGDRERPPTADGT